MEQEEVINTGSKEVEVMWGGLRYIFAPGQTKVFTKNIANEIVNESRGSLKLSSQVDEPVYSTSTDKNGNPMFRKDGKLISREEYEANAPESELA